MAQGKDETREAYLARRQKHEETRKAKWLLLTPDQQQAIRDRITQQRNTRRDRIRWQGRQLYATNESYRARKLASNYKYRNPIKDLAHSAISHGIRNGSIVPPSACEHCGNEPPPTITGRNAIEAHHYLGYEEKHWLDVQWLCASCHRKADYAAAREGERQCA